MTKTMLRAYAETNEVLKFMPQSYVSKIPQKLRELFEISDVDSFSISIDPNKSIQQQKLQYETRVILTILKMNYWASPEEKEIIQRTLIENDEKAKQKNDLSALLSHQSNASKENTTENVEQISNLPVKVENKSWFTRLIEKIKNIFKK